MHLLGFLIFGLVVGLIARLIMPGRQPIGILGTMLLGVVGSFIGGFLGNMFFGHGSWNHPTTAGWIGSVLGAFLLLLLIGRTRRPLWR